MIAVDTQILVHAYRAEMPQHATAAAALARLAESGKPWVIPWPCVHEFVGIVTHRRIFDPPATVEHALAQIQAWAESPWFLFLHEAGDHLVHLWDVLRASRAVGPKVHDAKIAAICLAHDVSEVWSVDRDFGRYPGLRVVNPLVPA